MERSRKNSRHKSPSEVHKENIAHQWNRLKQARDSESDVLQETYEGRLNLALDEYKKFLDAIAIASMDVRLQLPAPVDEPLLGESSD